MPGIVSNSTPLIHLAKIDELQLLHNFYGQVLIPQAVYDECVTEGKAYKAGTITQKANNFKAP